MTQKLAFVKWSQAFSEFQRLRGSVKSKSIFVTTACGENGEIIIFLTTDKQMSIEHVGDLEESVNDLDPVYEEEPWHFDKRRLDQLLRIFEF